MKNGNLLLVMVGLFIGGSAHAVGNLTEIVSDVHQAPGMTTDQIVVRGLQCIKSSSHNASENVDPATDGNVAYGIIRIEYSHMLINNIIRARVSVAAKEGRFKVAHTEIERYNEMARGYIGVHTGFGGGADKAREVLTAHATLIAECINRPGSAIANGDW